MNDSNAKEVRNEKKSLVQSSGTNSFETFVRPWPRISCISIKKGVVIIRFGIVIGVFFATITMGYLGFGVDCHLETAHVGYGAMFSIIFAVATAGGFVTSAIYSTRPKDRSDSPAKPDDSEQPLSGSDTQDKT